MPTSYNGIGTHYYGKKNITKRPGPCPHCHGVVELTSYDTRLWFIFLFIPIVPVGRKRIVDQCPACTRHYVVDLQKWETAKQLEISGALEEFRAHPTPEGAVAAHQQLMRFHQTGQAAEFQKVIAEQFADHPKVQAYLGSSLEHFGQPAEAAPFFERALSLRPDLPEARVGVARSCIRLGRLAEARKLLDFLEKPGAAQLYSLEPLEDLARAYQKAGSHNEALELFGRLLAELPHLASVKAFRKMVAKSEGELPGGNSILPKQKFSWRQMFASSGSPNTAQPAGRALVLLGIILAMAALGLAIANEYIRHHRSLYVVNSFPQPATIEIAGTPGIQNLRKVGQIQLSEGRHHASISGPLRQEVDFEIRTGYFSRWSKDPVWLLNVGGAAALLFESVSYGENPPPADFSIHFGQPFEFFPHVTHPFGELPDTIRMGEHETRVLTHLDIFNRDGAVAYEFLKQRGAPGQATEFAESYLRAHPADRRLLEAYFADLSGRHQTERLDRYLGAGLTNRPVATDWHRWYQRLHETPAQLPQLLADYDQMLGADPSNSVLLYLRGRIDPDRKTSRRLFQQAAESDPKNAYAFFALGYDRSAVGDWPAARQYLARAVELSPGDSGFAYSLTVTRLALGEATAVEKEARDQFRQDPLDGAAEIRLVHALAAQDRREDVLQETARFERRWLAKYGARVRGAADHLHRTALYAVGSFAELETSCAKDASAEGRFFLAQSLLEQGRVSEALKLQLEDSLDPLWLLAISVAWQQAGDTNAAVSGRASAADAMKAGNGDLAHAASFLSRPAAPAAEELDDIILAPQLKAVFLAALAQKYPEARIVLASAARRFNIDRRFPYHLVQRATADLPSSAERP